MHSIKAPAKINWFLQVGGLRADGYHEIRSLMQKITLFDRLSFSPSDDLVLKCSDDIPEKENLVYRAAVLLREAYGVKAGASILLEKEIPAGAGLGGGSSDAASALMGLNSFWSINAPRAELSGLAEHLGSDVPFFLHDPIALASGRGERLRPAKAEKRMDILLVKPPVTVSTAWAYRNYKAEGERMLTKKAGKVNNIEHFIRKIERAQLDGLTDAVNDLESVTIKSFPVIAEIKNEMRHHGAVLSLMSGSGPAVFGVFESPGRAKEASKVFDGFWTAVAETIID